MREPLGSALTGSLHIVMPFDTNRALSPWLYNGGLVLISSVLHKCLHFSLFLSDVNVFLSGPKTFLDNSYLIISLEGIGKFMSSMSFSIIKLSVLKTN